MTRLLRIYVSSMVALCSLSAAQVLAARPAGEPQPVFYASFDQGLEAEIAAGEAKPVDAKEVEFVPGLRGQAVRITEPSLLSYATGPNLPKERGTLELWVRPDWEGTEGKVRGIFHENGPDDTSKYPDSGAIQIFTVGMGVWFGVRVGPHYQRAGTADWRPREWHHIAYTWDHQVGGRAYVDGQFYRPRFGKYFDNYTWKVKHYDKFYIGSYSTRAKYKFNGALDEVRIYDRALSAQEIAQRFATLMPIEPVPDQTIFVAGRKSAFRIELANLSERTVRGDLICRIANEQGKTVAEKTFPKRGVSARASSWVSWSFTPGAVGPYLLHYRWQGKEVFERATALFAIAPGPAAPPKAGDGQPKLKLIQRIDCAAKLDADHYCDDATAQVVGSPLGTYREAGPEKFSRFCYRFQIANFQTPHLVVVKYPDDKERIFDITMTTPKYRSYHKQTGVFTGCQYPCTNKIQEHRFFLYPKEEDQAIVFTTWEEGHPAAAQSIEVYEIEGGLPPLKINPPSGLPGRDLALQWEDAAFYLLFGAKNTSMPEFYRTTMDCVEYMKNTGFNEFIYPICQYDGPWYPSRVESPYGNNRTGPHPGDSVELWLRIFGEHGIKFIPAVTILRLHSLDRQSETDRDKIIAGTDTANQVDNKGRVNTATFNPIHPLTQKQVLAFVDDIMNRYGKFPALQGLALYHFYAGLFWFGSLESGYGDYNARLFEKETGIKIPFQPPDPERFAKRYEYLTAPERREQWINWRCQKTFEFLEKIRQRVQRERKDFKLYFVTGRIPRIRSGHLGLDRYRPEGITWEQVSREAGVDLSLLAPDKGYVLQRWYEPSGFRLNKTHWQKTPLLAAGRQFHLDPRAWTPFAQGERRATWLMYPYFEQNLKPVEGFWWKGTWRAGALTAGHRFALDYYAQAVAGQDANLIGVGGLTICTEGYEPYLRKFAQAYRALPAKPFDDVNPGGDAVVVRQLRHRDTLYFYAMNREYVPAKVNIRIQGASAVTDLVNWQSVPLTGGTLSLNLEAYELRSFAIRGGTAQVVGASQQLPAEHLAMLRDRLTQIEKALATAEADKDPDLETYRRVVGQVREAFKNGRYFDVHRLSEGYWMSSLLHSVGIPAPLLSEDAESDRAFAPFPQPRKWLVCGPFDNPQSKGFEAPYGPEKDLLAGKDAGDQTYIGRGGQQVKWQIRKEQDGFVDLDAIFGGIDWAVAYALTHVRAPSEMSVTLGIGSDDGIKVWLNRQLIHSKLAQRSAIPGDDVVSAQLKAGWNQLLVKVEEQVGGWGFYLSIADPKRRTLTDLEFSAKPS